MTPPKDNLEQFLQVRNVTKTSADLYFYGYIVSNWWGAFDDCDQYPEKIKNFLDTVKDKDLNIYVNSGGGNVFAGMAIYNMLKRHKGHKVAYNDGLMASISSVIPLAADEIIMPANSIYMLHKPSIRIDGNADDMRGAAKLLDRLQQGLTSMYMEWTKPQVVSSQIDELINAESWLSAKEVTQYFNFTVSEKSDITACVPYGGFYRNIDNLAQSAVKARAECLNSIKNKEKQLLQTKLNLIKLKGVSR